MAALGRRIQADAGESDAEQRLRHGEFLARLRKHSAAVLLGSRRTGRDLPGPAATHGGGHVPTWLRAVRAVYGASVVYKELAARVCGGLHTDPIAPERSERACPRRESGSDAS